mmetsp:Transcript_61479/g.138539  ORF Transcript_61479/g.138539 Transcript_61479/m.138539 type:complete len:338 (+) Transcript_61479:83-1096(+)
MPSTDSEPLVPSSPSGSRTPVPTTMKDDDRIVALGPVMDHMMQECLKVEVGLTGYAWHEKMRQDLCIVSSELLAAHEGTTFLQRIRLAWGSYTNKSELIRTLQATEYMLTRTHNCLGIHDVIRAEFHCAVDHFRIMGDAEQGRKDINSVSNTTKMKLLNILTWMMIYAIPGWKAEEMGLVKGEDDRDPRVLMKVLASRVPEHIKNQGFIGDDKALRQIARAASNAPISVSEVGTVEPSWLDISAPFADFGREYAFCVGLKKPSKDAINDEVLAIETIVLSYYRSFLSDLLGTLKMQLDSASVFQAKVLGAMASVLLVGAKVVLTKSAEAEYEAWAES